MERLKEIETRLAEIAELVDSPEADLDALEEEVRALKAEKAEIEKAEEEARKAEEEKIEQRNALLEEVEERGVVVETFEEREKKDMVEIRNSAEYIEAYAEYIKTGEMRALLTENATNGTVAIPELVESTIKHAWDKLGILDKVTKTFMKGNVKVGVETAAGAAVIHTEGGDPITEESLTLAIVELVPQSFKKFKDISDEVYDLTSEEFLVYIYDEITYRIGKALEDAIVAALAAADGDDDVPQATLSAAVGVGTIAQAMSLLSDEATEITAIMNKGTWGEFKAAQAGAYYGYDVFEGVDLVFNNTLDAYSAADAGDVYMIVGDLGQGVQVNFPNGNQVDIKFDDRTLMTSDLIRILGRMFAGYGIVAPKAFCIVSKPSA